jgi:hypothetical protein
MSNDVLEHLTRQKDALHEEMEALPEDAPDDVLLAAHARYQAALDRMLDYEARTGGTS